LSQGYPTKKPSAQNAEKPSRRLKRTEGRSAVYPQRTTEKKTQEPDLAPKNGWEGLLKIAHSKNGKTVRANRKKTLAQRSPWAKREKPNGEDAPEKPTKEGRVSFAR